MLKIDPNFIGKLIRPSKSAKLTSRETKLALKGSLGATKATPRETKRATDYFDPVATGVNFEGWASPKDQRSLKLRS